MIGSTKIETGVTLVPQNTTTPSADGDLRYNSSTNKVELFNGAVDPLVTEADTATLTNKTLDTATNTITNLSNTNLNGSAGITNANLDDMPALTVKANNTGSSATPQDVLISTIVSAGGGVTTVGTFDSQPASSNGLSISAPDIYAQSASASNPGMVNTTTQTMAGAKTFSTSVTAPAHISSSANPATSGVVQLANADSISWRNAGNTADLALDINASNQLSVPVDLNINGHNIINTGTLTLPTSTDTLVGRATTDSLTNKTIGVSSSGLLSNALVFEEIATPVSNPPSGELALYPKSTGQFYTLNSSGVETPIGSGGGGSKNYLSVYTASTSSGSANVGNGNLEFGTTTGWNLATVTVSGSSPNYIPTGVPNIVSSTGNLSNAVTTSSIAGTYSLLTTAISAGWPSGQGIASNTFFIDQEDQAKPLTVSFYYKNGFSTSNTNWSGTGLNSFTVWIYDVTNAIWIQPAGTYGMTQSSGVGYCTATFQTSSNSTQYQFFIFSFQAIAAGGTLTIDDVVIGPQTAPLGAVITDWVAYTPANTGSWTTNATYAGQWRRVGADMEIQGRIILTGGVTGNALINLPAGYSIDTTRFSQGTVGFNFGIPLGTWGASNSAASINALGLVTYAGNAGWLLYQDAISGNLGTSITGTSPFTWASGTNINVFFKVPIVGWSSNVQMSSDTDTRVVAMHAHVTTPANVGTYSNSLSIVKYDTVDQDTHGAYSTSTGIYTIPVTGYYNIAATTETSGTGALNTTTQIDLINISTSTELAYYQFPFGGAITDGVITPISVQSVFLNAGTQLAVRAAFANTYSSAAYSVAQSSFGFYFSINRVSGPSVIAATESVNMSYTDTSGQAIGTSAAVFKYGTSLYDSHNAYSTSTGLYTVPVSGKYRVSGSFITASVALTTSQAINAIIEHNGAQYLNTRWAASGATVNYQGLVTGTVNCLAGDTLAIFASSGVATTGITAANSNLISIERVGN